jgi:hypothetical protein
MTDERNAKMLERVRALLAKADTTNFPAEAETFRAKADELMTAYSISAWQVEDAQRGLDRRATPTRRDFDRAWRHSPFRSELMQIFYDLARHCRCVVGHRGIDYSRNIAPVYGLPSDLDYLDALFTSVMLEVAKSLTPSVDHNGEVGHEVYKQRQAGIAWPEITRKVYKAGLVTLTKGEFKKLAERYPSHFDGMDPEDVGWDDLSRYDYAGFNGGVREIVKKRLANYNRRYVRDHGLQGERNYVRPEVYQRSFIFGFEQEMRDRIERLSASSRRAYDTEHGANSMALAVRDIRQQAIDLYDNEFPPPPPPPPLTEEEIKAIKDATRKLPAIRTREVVVDYGAMQKGREKARDTELTNNPSRRVGGERPGLPG